MEEGLIVMCNWGVGADGGGGGGGGNTFQDFSNENPRLALHALIC